MPNGQESAEASDPFGATRWTLVKGAQAGSSRALEELLTVYREPIVRHLTRHLGEDVGEDAAQEYLSGLLSSGYLAKASREHGKFRAFLLHDLRYFILGWRRKSGAAKRGGGLKQLSYEQLVADGMQMEHESAEFSPESFDQDWTVSLMAKVRDDLANSYQLKGHGPRFRVLSGFIELGGDAKAYQEAAEELQMTINAVKVAASRLRHEYAELLRSIVADSLASGESVEEELDYMRRCYLGALRGGD